MCISINFSIYRTFNFCRVCSAWYDLTHSRSLRKVLIIRHSSIWSPLCYKSIDLRDLGNLLQLDDVEHVVVKCGDWTWISKRGVSWACYYLDHLLNASKCPKLRQITFGGMGVNMRTLRHLSVTCKFIHLKNAITRPYFHVLNSGSLINSWFRNIELSTRCRTVRCAATGRLHVRLDEFWDAIDATVKPLSEEEMSWVMLHLPNFRSRYEADITEICKR